MMYCRTCQAENPNSATECDHCGADLRAIRVIFCNACLAQNRKAANRCIVCDADLHVVRKNFATEMKDRSLVVNRRTFGVVGGAIASTLFGLGCAVLVPGIFLHKWAFYSGLLLVFAIAWYGGRRLADSFNDTSMS